MLVTGTNRRAVIAALSSAAAWPLTARAQQSNSTRRIAVLMGFSEGDPVGQSFALAMRQKLESLGWVENRKSESIIAGLEAIQTKLVPWQKT
jgi:hypothetical protein